MSVHAVTNLVGRICLALVFLVSAVGNMVPNFNTVREFIETEGVPSPTVMLLGGILFLIIGSLSVILGLKARAGASLLIVFLLLATYYFHDFWNFEGDEAQQQMISFMKNLALLGAMLMIVSRGSGPMSLDGLLNREIKSQSDNNQMN